LEYRGEKKDWDRYRVALRAGGTRDNRVLIEKEHASGVVAGLDFRARRLVLVLIPMLVHDGRRMFMAFVIGVEMDVDPRQQRSANQCAQRQNRQGAANP
jgi:hypothetical protein